MSKCGIYQITLKHDGRSYIGSALNIDARWRQHRGKSKLTKNTQVISRAISKYGVDSFEWTVVEECLPEELLVREQHWLDTIQPFVHNGNGFNVRTVAESNFGVIRTIESRQKQSARTTGVSKSEKHKQSMREAWHSPARATAEYRQYLSNRMKGDANPAKSLDVRKKISIAMTGKTWKHDADRVAKHSAHRKGKKCSEEARANMKEAQAKNKTRSPAAKENFYLAQRILYEITTPTGNTFQIYSRELKIFCAENGLCYSNLITTAKTGKPYKRGWVAKVLLN